MSDRRVNEDKRVALRRFTALGVATPLVGLGGGDDGEDDSSGSSDAQGATVGYVASTPGAHFSKVHDNLQLEIGEAQYHLRDLIDDGTLEASRNDDYKRFFPTGRFSEFEQITLGYLRRDTSHGVLVHLLRDPAATGSELATRLGASRATVSTYAKELNAVDLLSREDDYAARNPETVITLPIHYADPFGSDVVTFADDAADLIRFDPRLGRELVPALLRQFRTGTFSGGAGTREGAKKAGMERRGAGDDGVPCAATRGRTRRGAHRRRCMAGAE